MEQPIKKDLLIIISITILISLIVIITFTVNFGTIRIIPQIIRFVLTVLLGYFLYKEKQWARWICVVLFLLSGIGGILVILKEGLLLSTSYPFLMCLFYLVAGVYLGFIRKWNK